MLTVVVGFDASGNSSTFRPLARRYSVMPSADGPCVTPFGSCTAWAGTQSSDRAYRVMEKLALYFSFDFSMLVCICPLLLEYLRSDRRASISGCHSEKIRE